MSSEATFAEQRRELAASLKQHLPPEQAWTIAFAVVPWLDHAEATFTFFERLREVQTAVEALNPTENPDGAWDASYKLVDRYRDVASEYGAARYVAAAEAAMSGADPSKVDIERPSSDLGDTLPTHVTLKVGSHLLHLEALASQRGNLWYSLVSKGGGAARSGVAVESKGEGLPSTVDIEGTTLSLGPAPLWDKASRRYVEGAFEPFDLKRQIEQVVALGGHRFECRIVVSVRRDGRWNVTARLVPQEPVRADTRGTSPHRAGRGSTSAAATPAGGFSNRESELLRALRQG